jgi:predicted Fe-Mo cluster-binding NifX family protein
MKIAVTASGEGLDAPASPVFGRCQWYVLVDTETMEVETLANPALAASGGAGVQAAQHIAGLGIQAVVTGNVGPNAYQVLNAAGVAVYLYTEGSVRQAIEALQAGQLSLASGATAPSHAGLGGQGHGMGQGYRRQGRKGS